MEVIGGDDVIVALEAYMKRRHIPAGRVGSAGLAGMPWRIGEAVRTVLGAEPTAVDKMVFGNARRKTAEQIAKARAAVKIAERGYEQLLQVARPGMREGCAILTVAKNALAKATRSGAGVTAAILDAEHAAYGAGAQDVRVLFSLDAGRTLRPFEAPVAAAVDPLHAYIALRYAGYWVDGFLMVARLPRPIWKQANDALEAIIRIAKAGTPCSELVCLAEEKIKPNGPHPMTAGNLGNSIGSSLEEAPQLLGASNDDKLEAGCAYTLRVGASDGREHHAIASAIISIHPQGNDVLWSDGD